MGDGEIKKYLANIGSNGGRAGTGESKRRGGSDYYKWISGLAAKARKAKSRSKKQPAKAR